MKSIMLVKKFLGLIEMTSGQVDATILDKINGKPGPPSPPPLQIKDGKMARFCPSRGLILGEMGVFLFHFILSKIVASACPNGKL